MFQSTLKMLDGRIAQITLEGELDAASAGTFKSAIEEAATQTPARLVLRVHDLRYMASAGLRVLIFAKQKMGPNVDVQIVGAQPAVKQTIAMTGFDRSVILIDEPVLS
jgi:stage II sporulation protein AA (anti-sigma F factor antagonist)